LKNATATPFLCNGNAFDEVLVVERWAKDCDDKMGEVGRTFVKLKVACNAVVGEIFCHTRFGYAEMLSKTRFDGLGATPDASTS
jgi:hypothetical protein